MALENIVRHKLCLMFLRHLTYRNFVDLNMITLAGYEGILVYLYPVPPTTPQKKMLTISLKYFWKLTQLNKFFTWVDLLELIIGAMKKGPQNGA